MSSPLVQLSGIRKISLGIGTGAVEGGEGLIQHRDDALLLVQRRNRNL